MWEYEVNWLTNEKIIGGKRNTCLHARPPTLTDSHIYKPKFSSKNQAKNRLKTKYLNNLFLFDLNKRFGFYSNSKCVFKFKISECVEVVAWVPFY